MGDGTRAPDGRIYCQCKAISLDEAYWKEKPVIKINLPILQHGRHSRERCEPRPTAAYIR